MDEVLWYNHYNNKLKAPIQWAEYIIIIVYNTFKYIFVNSKEDFFHFVKELQRLRDLESEGHVGCLEIPACVAF